MNTMTRSMIWAGVLTLGSLGFGANHALAQGFGLSYTSPGFSLGVGAPAYAPPPVYGYGYGYGVLAPPPVIYARPPVVVAPPYYAGRPYHYGPPRYYGGGYRGPQHYRR